MKRNNETESPTRAGLLPVILPFRANVNRSAGMEVSQPGDWFMVVGDEVPAGLEVLRDSQSGTRSQVHPGVIYPGAFDTLYLYHAAQAGTASNTFHVIVGYGDSYPRSAAPAFPARAVLDGNASLPTVPLVQALQLANGGGGAWDMIRQATIFRSLNTAALSSTVNVYAATAGKTFRLLACRISASPQLYALTGGGVPWDITASITDQGAATWTGGNNNPTLTITTPGNAPTITSTAQGPTTGILTFGRGLVASATGRTVQFTQSNHPAGVLAAAGSWTVEVWGVED